MKKTKVTALVLALCMALGLLAGCGDTAEEAPEPTEQPEASAAPDLSEVPEVTGPTPQQILAEKRTVYPADTVVVTVNGVDVTWDMFYYLLSGTLQEFAYYTGALPTDYSQVMPDGETTVAGYFDGYTLEQLKVLGAVIAKAEKEKLSVDEEVMELARTQWANAVENIGSEEAVMDRFLMTENVHRLLTQHGEFLRQFNEAAYGENGGKIPETEILRWAEDNGYIRVKHILYPYPVDEEGKVIEEQKPEAMDKAGAALEQLKGQTGEALETAFTELMNADSQDQGGLMSFPDGYIFRQGTMVPEFEAVAFGLEDYELSGVVETPYGCHILLGLPMDPDGPTMEMSSSGAPYTLRQLVAGERFSRDIESWVADTEIVWAPEFESFSVADLFGGPAEETPAE